jgi:hypothetical protein
LLNAAQIVDQCISALRVELKLGHWMRDPDAFDQLFFQHIGVIARKERAKHRRVRVGAVAIGADRVTRRALRLRNIAPCGFKLL